MQISRPFLIYFVYESSEHDSCLMVAGDWHLLKLGFLLLKLLIWHLQAVFFLGLQTIMLLYGGATLEESFWWKVSGKFQLRMLIFITSGKEQSGSWPKEEWKNCSSSKHCGIAFWNRPKHNDAISHHFTGFQLCKDSLPLSHTDDILLKNWGFVATFKS